MTALFSFVLLVTIARLGSGLGRAGSAVSVDLASCLGFELVPVDIL